MDGVDGSCSCICENEGWDDHNVLGMASCVPTKAHESFGAVGLMVTTASLCHCVYHLCRQVSTKTHGM